MDSRVLSAGDTSAAQIGQQPKEPGTMLPAPSTMSADQLQPPGVGQRLIWLLQYLNPLFYARLAQSFVSSVVGTNDEGTAASSGRQPAAISAPVPADATAIDCGYGRSTRETEFAGLPHLDLEPTIPTSPAGGGDDTAVESSPDVTPEPIQLPASHSEMETEDPAEDAVQGTAAYSPEITPVVAAPVEDKSVRKTGKKGKRGKGKHKGGKQQPGC
ncbi:hypothetical protein GGF46_000883 [Coemansia sp. RSA 552]|nr:hypothetical protein GGF46_000883 [Coemansia sp. RSA 552]